MNWAVNIVVGVAVAVLTWWSRRRDNADKEEAIALVDALENANRALRWRATAGESERVHLPVKKGAPRVSVPGRDTDPGSNT